jgi:SAM-dependent methyltransferase
MAKYLHIDDDVHILTDEEAKRALERENDQAFLSADSGIVKVTEKRWRSAQTAERKHWMVLGINGEDDRNEEHSAAFNNYQALGGATYNAAIELGCGPFTNLRLIANHCSINACSLLDPLIKDYLNHPHCAYTHDALIVDKYQSRSLPARIQRAVQRRLPEAMKRSRVDRLRRKSSTRTIPIKELIAAPIETMPTERVYDLVVILNVIEHCYDIQQVFQNILTVMPSGSILVFHDKLYSHDEVKERTATLYDAAHPLMVDQAILYQFLEQNFVSLYEKVATATWEFMGEENSADMLYYIGRRK